MAEIKIIDHTTTVSSPDVNYKLYGTLVDRTSSTAKINFKIVSRLDGDSTSSLGYGLKATIKCNNVVSKDVTIKGNSMWRGTSTHTKKDISMTVTGLTSNVSTITVSFRVVRTDGSGAGHMGSAITKNFTIGTLSSSSSSSSITSGDNTNYCPYIETYSDPVIGCKYPIQLFRPLGHKADIELQVNGSVIKTWSGLYRVIETLDFNNSAIKGIFSKDNNTKSSIKGTLVCYALDKSTGERLTSKNFTPDKYNIQLGLGEYLARPSAPTIKDNTDDATNFSEDIREFKVSMPGNSDDFKFGAVQNSATKWQIKASHDSSYVEYSWDTDQRILTVKRKKSNLNDISIQIRAIDSRGIIGAPTTKLCFPGKAGILYRDQDRWQGVSF